jgi:cytochrome oxidase Cu insertion factor (SCO1/SenC/PrrC family)
MDEIGLSHPAPGVKGLGLILSVRQEGVPARNLIGNDLGFRRPGFGIALTPGFIYTHGNHMVQFSVGKLLIRDRTKSVPEKINGSSTGDAAFANYVWMAAYTLKLPGKRSVEAASPTGATQTVASAITSGKAPSAGPDTFKPFSLKTLEGQKKTLKDYANKVTLVNFFYPRCPFCNLEFPEIQKIYDKYKDKGLSAVWINILPEEEKLIPGWQVAKNFTVPVLVGGSQDALQREYGINGTPSTFLLDGKGKILYHIEGYNTGDEKVLESKIAAALNPDAAPVVTTQAEPLCPPGFERVSSSFGAFGTALNRMRGN